jgi:lysozyme family protein
MSPREIVARCIADFEGGDSNRADDRGGLTHYGLTLRTFEDYRPGATATDLLALTRDDVIDIITEIFALRPGYYLIADQWVMWAVIDFAINSSARIATMALQRAAGVLTVDGIFGRQSEQIVSRMNPELLFRKVMAQRIRYFGQIIRHDHTQADNAGGWFDRAASLLESAA